MKNEDTGIIELEVRHISKHFGKVQALNDVSLSLIKGEIHTLLGENGAGKSTLMNILYGLYQKDSGEVLLGGKLYEIRNPHDSLSLGLGMVPQSFKLVGDMKIWENILLYMGKTGFFIQKEKLKEKIAGFSRLFNFGLEDRLETQIEGLSEGERQKVEILKLLACGAHILLFDEATNVLAPNELDAFLKVIKEMNRKGYTILYITHRLQEALEISDRISVFRKGELVGTISGREATYNKLTTMMVGAEFNQSYVVRRPSCGDEVLSVSGLNVYDERAVQVLRDVSFTLNKGEIVGLAGIEGNGSGYLAEAVMGLCPVRSGSISYCSEDLQHLSTSKRMKLGINFLPSGNTIVPSFCIRKNAVLDYPEKPPFSSSGFLNWKEIAAYARKIVETYQVQTPDIFLPASKLSGGNKQRLSLGRKIEAEPKLMIAYHPTKGLDINSQHFIYEKLSEMRDRGSTILFIGTDLDELYQICNRLLVIYRGEIVGTYDDLSAVSKIEIGVLMTGGSSYIKGNGKKE